QNTNFDIIGLISPEKIKMIQNGKTYLVKGKFKKFLKGDFKNYVNGMVYTPSVEVSEDILSKDRKVADLGIILMEIKEIVETRKL
ncbi:hypothetical protein, partial [Aquirufa beregesia]